MYVAYGVLRILRIAHRRKILTLTYHMYFGHIYNLSDDSIGNGFFGAPHYYYYYRMYIGRICRVSACMYCCVRNRIGNENCKIGRTKRQHE